MQILKKINLLINNQLNNYLGDVLTPPPNIQIPYVELPITTKKKWSLAKKKLKRNFILLILGQKDLLEKKAPQNTKKILFIYFGTPSLGDSLMDLSFKQFFNSYDLKVDMLTSEVVKNLYDEDNCFRKIVCTTKELDTSYDHIIIDSLNSKNLWYKFSYLRKAKFSSLIGLYKGRHYSRKEFTYQAFFNQLNLKIEIQEPKTYIRPLEELKPEHFNICIII
jgi:hypothetical protein